MRTFPRSESMDWSPRLHSIALFLPGLELPIAL